MKLLKKLALVAALSSVATYASALTPITDTELSKVSGQDGVSIAADLHINIGSFVYTDTDTNGGSVSFNGIKINGVIAATLDVINNATFLAEASAASGPASVLGVTGGAGLAAFQPAGDVVKIAIPEITTTKSLNMSVDSIKMGGSNASYGSMAMNDVKLQGTTVYIWAH
jgi:hypothetical protein